MRDLCARFRGLTWEDYPQIENDFDEALSELEMAVQQLKAERNELKEAKEKAIQQNNLEIDELRLKLKEAMDELNNSGRVNENERNQMNIHIEELTNKLTQAEEDKKAAEEDKDKEIQTLQDRLRKAITKLRDGSNRIGKLTTTMIDDEEGAQIQIESVQNVDTGNAPRMQQRLQRARNHNLQRG